MIKLQILGTGCSKCEKLATNTKQAAKELGIEYELIKITDIDEIINFGVIMTPALAIDNNVKIVGKVATVEEIKKMLGQGNICE